MMELINAFCVFQKAGGTKQGSFYYLVVGAYQDEHKDVTHLAYEVKFNPTKNELKFENLNLNFKDAQRSPSGCYVLQINPFSEQQQKTVNRSIVEWLRKPEKLLRCKDKVTGELKANSHYKSLGMGKFFILPHGEPMDKFAFETFCLNIGSENVRMILNKKQIV